jgi:pimeloyl-ACP methyl ester carboxylesterase
LEELSQQFNVIAWDAPGTGSSSDPPDRFTFADWSHCLAKFLDALDVAHSHLVGLSWGGVLLRRAGTAAAARRVALRLRQHRDGSTGGAGFWHRGRKVRPHWFDASD